VVKEVAFQWGFNDTAPLQSGFLSNASDLSHLNIWRAHTRAVQTYSLRRIKKWPTLMPQTVSRPREVRQLSRVQEVRLEDYSPQSY